MPTTTKMGIVYPSSTDLVKDGATAMGTISTTVDNKTGMVLIKSATFSAVSSVSLDAGTFSSTYDYYKLFISGVSSADVAIAFRLRTSGTDNTTSNYSYTGSYTNNAAGPSRSSGVNATAWSIGTIGSTAFSSDNSIFYPNSTTYRTFITSNTFAQYGTSDRQTDIVGGVFNATTQFDSLTFFPGSGTITGRYSVFGVNQ
jgi:hypothetical protein